MDWQVGAAVADVFELTEADPDDQFEAVYGASLGSHGKVEVRFTREDIQFWVSKESWQCAGACSAASNLPAFRFCEVIEICDLMEGGDYVKAAFFLLLAPACSDVEGAERLEIDEMLRIAWRLIFSDARVEGVEQIVEATGKNGTEWTFSSSFGWVNSRAHSFRNPRRSSELNLNDVAAIRKFFQGLPKSYSSERHPV
ncbi:MAG TPA: hypothetical protein VK956_10370 [Verrucomicrobium sp.]|nr:hypothetical protein [Verrucomicrobium sp.]